MNEERRQRRRTAAELCRHVRLGEEARRLLREGQSPRAFFEALVAADQWSAAVRFLPHALSKRAAVWWGSLCLWHVSRPEPPALVADALETAVCWVRSPTEANRRAAEQAARAAGTRRAAGCLAFAAFWSGGSMTRPGLPAVAPAEHLTAKMVGVAVLLAAAEYAPMRLRACYQEFLAVGRDVARGVNRWETPAAAPSPVVDAAPVLAEVP